MIFESEYELGQLVYLITDDEQKERMITGVKFNLNGIIYTLQKGTEESFHFEKEISAEKDILKQLNICNSDDN